MSHYFHPKHVLNMHFPSISLAYQTKTIAINARLIFWKGMGWVAFFFLYLVIVKYSVEKHLSIQSQPTDTPLPDNSYKHTC